MPLIFRICIEIILLEANGFVYGCKIVVVPQRSQVGWLEIIIDGRFSRNEKISCIESKADACLENFHASLPLLVAAYSFVQRSRSTS